MNGFISKILATNLKAEPCKPNNTRHCVKWFLEITPLRAKNEQVPRSKRYVTVLNTPRKWNHSGKRI